MSNLKEELIEISRSEYFRLRLEELTLDMMRDYGVDNWQGYGDCFRPDFGKSFKEHKRDIYEEIFNTDLEEDDE